MARPPASYAFDELLSRGVYSLLRAVNGRSTAAAAPASAGSRLTADEEELVTSVDTYLRRGLDLRRFWQRAYPDRFAEKFDLAVTVNRPDSSFGFFDEAEVGGKAMRLMGNFQEMFYDQPKSPTADRELAARWTHDQIRQFVLRYFMRVSDFRPPQAYVDENRPPVPALLRPVSLCPDGSAASDLGFGFSQLLYKRRSGEIGRFPENERFAIIDLRRLGSEFEWILAKVRIFNFSFSYRPFGATGPSLTLPLAEESYLILTRDFILDEERPEPGELGHYGLGYAFLRNPGSGLLAYGPGEFEAAIELIDFHVETSGQVRVSMVFVSNRPDQIVRLPLNPLAWGCELADLLSGGRTAGATRPARAALAAVPFANLSFDPVYSSIDLLNFLTGGLAARELCIARETLEFEFLVKHFQQHYETLAGSLQTWRQIPDWLDEAALPAWVIHGRAA